MAVIIGVLGSGPTADVPLYGVAAAQRCLEEFDALLEHAGTFGSEAWQEARRLFDVHRIANMLLAQDDIGLRLTGTPPHPLICFCDAESDVSTGSSLHE